MASFTGEIAALGDLDAWYSRLQITRVHRQNNEPAESDQTSVAREQELGHDDYTVGWVCALSIEMAAAKAMLDTVHPGLPNKEDDGNTYTFGSIAGHNVVIACLPAGQYGTNNAATVASNMRRSFPSIDKGLMVGIGGGVPETADIRLGDVAVGIDIIQHDFGKTIANQRLERTSFPIRPPQILTTAIAKMKADHDVETSRVPAILSNMLERYPSMTRYAHPGLPDDLFCSSYNHAGGIDNCKGCDDSKVIHRDSRDSTAPVFHYGRIASGNQVIKDGKTRAQLAEEIGMVCFEMEAAGLMDHFPCLVIRGICDYSDSHKNKGWQPYSAAVAAAYAKELLLVIPKRWKEKGFSNPTSSGLDTRLLMENTPGPSNPTHLKQLKSPNATAEVAQEQGRDMWLRNYQSIDWLGSVNQRLDQGFRHDGGCRVSLKVDHDELVSVGMKIGTKRGFSSEGIPLADVLETYDLVIPERLALAHALGLTIWQFYTSPIINRTWSSRTIWVIVELILQTDKESPTPRTYISFHPDAINTEFDTSGFVTTGSSSHRYPQIQVLATLLLEIGIGRPFRFMPDFQKESQRHEYVQIFTGALKELEMRTWQNSHHKSVFIDAVKDCFMFADMMRTDPRLHDNQAQTFHRCFLRERVVSRLEWLSKSSQTPKPPIPQQSTSRLVLEPQRGGGHFTPMPENNMGRSSPSPINVKPQSGRRPLDRSEFEILIICALPLEADAVYELFDKVWDENGLDYGKAPGDANTYSTGTMANHTIVLAHLPGMGKSNAAAAAANCRSSFPNLNLTIVVGICGAVPYHRSGEEIILGDVIISEGLVQNDMENPQRYGIRSNSGHLPSLGRPSVKIRSWMSKLGSARTRRQVENKMLAYLDELQDVPELKANYPGQEEDRLFEASYRHVDDTATCPEAGCKGSLIPRTRLLGDPVQPKFYFGVVASGDKVVKSAEIRDTIAKESDVIGFEMDTLGVWDILPTIMIKGACDYADGHKSKAWQRYAAATAAACTKALLHQWVK